VDSVDGGPVDVVGGVVAAVAAVAGAEELVVTGEDGPPGEGSVVQADVNDTAATAAASAHDQAGTRADHPAPRSPDMSPCNHGVDTLSLMTSSSTGGPRVGLVGYGGAGRAFHAPLLARAGLEVAAVATGNPERAAQVGEDLPGAAVVADLTALLATDGIDLVVLASPSGVHVAQAAEVVAAGIPVVVDKPLGVDATSALEAVDVAARAGVPLTVFQNRRYDPEFRTLAKVVSDGLVGRVIRAELRWERWRPVPKQRWRENAPPQEGGGLLLDLYPHLVDQAHLLFGPIETVYAEVSSLTTVSEDTAFLSCRHTSGVVSHLGSTALAAAPGPWLRLLGREAAFVVGGLNEEPTAFTEWLPSDADHLGWLVRSDGEREAVPRVPGDQADFYREVAQALAQPDPQAAMPVDPRDAVHALAVIDAARMSAESGRVVEVITPGEAP
jgi:predicted dehydrogenase